MNSRKGIDYGYKKTNINFETGIRNGVIHVNEVCQVWCDESEAYYDDIDEDDIEVLEFAEPTSWHLNNDEYKAVQDEYGDIFITKAPFYTYAQFCSPCAPGACYLMEYLEKDDMDDDNRCYCFGHDWFDGEKAPYPVFDVETGQEVLP